MRSARGIAAESVTLLLLLFGSGCGAPSHKPGPTDAEQTHPPGHQMMGGEVEEKHFDRLPVFAFKDLEGNTVSSAQFEGKVLLVDVWATWCPPCKQEMPWFQELQDAYGPRGFEAIGISIDVAATDAARFARALNVTYTMLHRPEIMQEWGLLGLPTTFVVDREGVIRRRVVGFEYKAEFESAVKELL